MVHRWRALPLRGVAHISLTPVIRPESRVWAPGPSDRPVYSADRRCNGSTRSRVTPPLRAHTQAPSPGATTRAFFGFTPPLDSASALPNPGSSWRFSCSASFRPAQTLATDQRPRAKPPSRLRACGACRGRPQPKQARPRLHHHHQEQKQSGRHFWRRLRRPHQFHQQTQLGWQPLECQQRTTLPWKRQKSWPS